MITKDEAFRLTRFSFADIADSATAARDGISRSSITYSPKVFLPITHEYDPGCVYCSDQHDVGDEPHMSLDDIRRACTQGAEHKVSEASLKLAETYDTSQAASYTWLRALGYASMIDYVIHAAQIALMDMHLLPHINAGAISDREIRSLKEVCISQSLSLESIAGRLSEPGGPNFGIPGKSPARRLATIEAAGRAQVPFSTGMLIGVGDTRHERVEGLLAIRELNDRYGHIQEIIIQKNVSAQSDPALEEEYLWSIAATRLIFDINVHVQSHPHSLSELLSIISAGVDDVGGIALDVEAVTHNQLPWANLHSINQEASLASRVLIPRTSVYPEFIHKPGFIADHLRSHIAQHTSPQGYLKVSPLTSSDDPATSQTVDLREESDTLASNAKRTSNFPTSKISH